MLKGLILETRSYRRFKENKEITKKQLEGLVDYARLSASANNNQPLKYMLVNDKEKNKKMFRHLKWAGALENWNGPAEGERPAAYIIVLGDQEISDNYWADPGIALQSIRLAAREKGLGSCILAAIDREGIRADFQIENNFDVLYVIALGEPAEKIKLVEAQDGNTTYWRDEKDIHYVPKRDLDNIILK